MTGLDDVSAWLPALLACLLAAGFFAWPLLRARALRPPAEDDAARVYRAQFGELDRDLEDGRIGRKEHEAARAEVARRLLAAARPGPGEATAGAAAPARAPTRPSGRVVIAGLALLLPAGAGLLYLAHGSPGLPAVPFAEQRREAESAETILAQLRATIASQAEGSEGRRQGLILLGGVERRRGDWPAAEAAWREALAIRFEPGLAEDLAELMVARAGGLVPAEARALLARVRATGVTGPRLVYLTARADLQAGQPRAAMDALDRLLAEAPPEAPWRAVVSALRDEASGLALAGGAGPQGTGSQAAGPNIARPDGASAPPAGAQAGLAPGRDPAAEAAMIASMVARLEARLAETPEDGEGWLRLARAKRVLGDRAAAAAALSRAATLLPGDPRVVEERAALEG